MKKSSRTSVPDFVAEHRPKHEPLEQLQKLFPKDGPLPHDQWRKQLAELGHLKAQLVTSVPKPKTLMEMYKVDPCHIYQDLLARPNHYTPEQTQLVESLFLKRLMPIEPTREQLDDLFQHFLEQKEQVQRRQEIMRKVTDISDVAEFEGDGKPQFKEPTYEDQDFGNLIKIV